MKTPAEYRLMPYRRVLELHTEEDGGRYFVARVAEIPWIRIDGADQTEAFLRLDAIFDDCIQSMIDEGDRIPQPEAWPALWGEVEDLVPAPASVEAVAVVPLSIQTPKDAAPWSAVEEGNTLLAVAVGA